jgi:hypothetical protein
MAASSGPPDRTCAIHHRANELLRYACATKSKLSLIELLHNAAVRLATAFCRPNRLGTLCMVSSEPSLSGHSNFLACNCVARLATQHKHPYTELCFIPPQTRGTNFSNQLLDLRVCVHLQGFLQRFSIELPQIISIRLPRVMP